MSPFFVSLERRTEGRKVDGFGFLQACNYHTVFDHNYAEFRPFVRLVLIGLCRLNNYQLFGIGDSDETPK